MTDGSADPTTDETEGATDTDNEAKEDQSDTKTALLPIAFFQGKDLKPGGICSVKIESVRDDQCEVSYVPHQEEEKQEEYAAPNDMMA